MITQNGESSHDLLLSVTNRKALTPGGGGGGLCPPVPAFKTLITLLPVTFSQLDPRVLVEEKGLYFDSLLFNRWLKLFNCQIFI